MFTIMLKQLSAPLVPALTNTMIFSQANVRNAQLRICSLIVKIESVLNVLTITNILIPPRTNVLSAKIAMNILVTILKGASSVPAMSFSTTLQLLDNVEHVNIRINSIAQIQINVSFVMMPQLIMTLTNQTA